MPPRVTPLPGHQLSIPVDNPWKEPIMQMFKLDNVPASITRPQVIGIAEQLGLNANDIFEIRITSHFVHVTVHWKDEEGRRRLAGLKPGDGWVKHVIAVPVIDAENEEAGE